MPAGTQHGQRFRLRKRGVPRLGEEGRGDLYVEVHVWVPAVTDDAGRALLRGVRRSPPRRPAAELRPPRRRRGEEGMARGRRRATRPSGRSRSEPGKGKYYMISVVAKSYGIHPQTLRLYEREGLLKPSRTEGNTRLYSEEDLRQLEVILNLTRDLGVNLAGVEIVLNMRRKMEQMQAEIAGVPAPTSGRSCMRTSQEGWEEKLEQALVRVPPSPLVRTVRTRADGL